MLSAPRRARLARMAVLRRFGSCVEFSLQVHVQASTMLKPRTVSTEIAALISAARHALGEGHACDGSGICAEIRVLCSRDESAAAHRENGRSVSTQPSSRMSREVVRTKAIRGRVRHPTGRPLIGGYSYRRSAIGLGLALKTRTIFNADGALADSSTGRHAVTPTPVPEWSCSSTEPCEQGCCEDCTML